MKLIRVRSLRLREYFSFYYTSRECERGVLRFSPIKQGESLNSEISLSFLAIISEESDHTRALNGDRVRERGAGNRVDAPRKRERRRRERRREKKYDFTVCVQTYFLFTTKRTNT